MRHALRTAIRPCLSILFVVCALICSPKSVKTEFSPALVDAQGRSSLGYLRHRGEMYDLRDWSSTVYDAGEKNETVAHFFPAPMIADEGSLTGLLAVTSWVVDEQVHIIDFVEQVYTIGFEDIEEEQCVEITIID